jgi:hypothetical protein
MKEAREQGKPALHGRLQVEKLIANSMGPDQTSRMCRLVRIHADRKTHYVGFVVMRLKYVNDMNCEVSKVLQCIQSYSLTFVSARVAQFCVNMVTTAQFSRYFHIAALLEINGGTIINHCTHIYLHVQCMCMRACAFLSFTKIKL